MSEDGGGASRSTDPAAGSSAATDVSLREHLAALRQADSRYTEAELRHVRELAQLQREADQLAIGKALDSSKELAEKHNDLIRSGEKKDETYATKVDLERLSSVQGKMIGGLIVLAAIGLTKGKTY